MRGRLWWDFSVRAALLPDGRFRVRVRGRKSGAEYERIGYHPLWELIRIVGSLAKSGPKGIGPETGRDDSARSAEPPRSAREVCDGRLSAAGPPAAGAS